MAPQGAWKMNQPSNTWDGERGQRVVINLPGLYVGGGGEGP